MCVIHENYKATAAAAAVVRFVVYYYLFVFETDRYCVIFCKEHAHMIHDIFVTISICTSAISSVEYDL